MVPGVRISAFALCAVHRGVAGITGSVVPGLRCVSSSFSFFPFFLSRYMVEHPRIPRALFECQLPRSDGLPRSPRAALLWVRRRRRRYSPNVSFPHWGKMGLRGRAGKRIPRRVRATRGNGNG